MSTKSLPDHAFVHIVSLSQGMIESVPGQSRLHAWLPVRSTKDLNGRALEVSHALPRHNAGVAHH